MRRSRHVLKDALKRPACVRKKPAVLYTVDPLPASKPASRQPLSRRISQDAVSRVTGVEAANKMVELALIPDLLGKRHAGCTGTLGPFVSRNGKNKNADFAHRRCSVCKAFAPALQGTGFAEKLGGSMGKSALPLRKVLGFFWHFSRHHSVDATVDALCLREIPLNSLS